MPDNRTRLEIAIRRNRARQIAPAWYRDLGDACKMQIVGEMFISTDDTINLKKNFFEKVRSHQGSSQLWHPSDSTELFDQLAKLAGRVGSLPVVLFSSVDELLGAVRLPADTILANAQGVIAVVSEDLCIATDDLSSGLSLEFNYYNSSGHYYPDRIHELTSWGLLRV
jgi:hypothetical protein